jgi:antitoxin HicB
VPDALRHAADAIEEALASRIADDLDVPEPTARHAPAVDLPLMTVLKVGLYREMKATGVTRAELTRRLHWKRESVERLFRLGHSSRPQQLDAAFRALGRAVDVKIEKADALEPAAA